MSATSGQPAAEGGMHADGTLDAELDEFLRFASMQLGPPDTDVERRRRRYERLADLAGAPRAPRVAREDLLLPRAHASPVRVRRYLAQDVHREAAPLALYLHGGGWSAGSLASHDGLCAWLASAARLELVAVDYRLCPENAHPAALEDSEFALQWVHRELANGRPVALLGDSAGAHLACATALKAVQAGRALAWLGLLYPAVSPTADLPSHREHANSPGLSREHLLQYWEWLGGEQGRGNVQPYFDLLRVHDWRGLPRTHILSAQCDPVRDEAQALAGALSASGVPVTHRCAPGMPHGFARFLARSCAAEAEMASFARELGRALTLPQRDPRRPAR